MSELEIIIGMHPIVLSNEIFSLHKYRKTTFRKVSNLTRVELLPLIYRFTGKLFLPFYR
jgi:hypothetical protein